MADASEAERTTGAPDPVGLTDASREQMERYRVAHATQVLTILLSDLEGSTQQQSTLGNVRAAELVRAHRAVFRAALAEADGEEVETAGDSFLVVFATPSEAVKFALRMQAAMRAARAHEPGLPPVRVGVHQGQVVVERHEEGPKRLDIYGLQISAAARITDLARGGQVLCSRAVFDDARAILSGADLAGLEPVVWCNHGPYRFKGVADAYEVCEVGERGRAPLAAPVATAKGWPAEQADEELGWRPAVGATVPGTNWVLEERLGREEARPSGSRRYRGAFGEVWKAFNPGDKSRQVFKFCFKRDRLAALKREARLLKRLHRYRHPNLVEVYDVTEGDKPPYYLEMEYVEGPSLDEWLAGNPPRAERLDIIAQIADALDTVHAAGIYHRDIKPSNLLLARREDGALVAKLTDFGLGATKDEDILRSLYATRVEGVAGTWDYMAPELRHGEPPSARSDLYSLGVTLYQVLCGDLERTLGDWERHVDSEVLREDIGRCIATDPAARWASAAELSRALRSHDERLRERQLRRDREAQRRRIQRLGTISGLAAAAALVLAALGAYAFVQRRIARRQEAVAQKERDEAVKARRRTEAELYFSNILLATRQIEQQRYAQAQDVLWASPEHLRNWEWGHLLARCTTDLCTLRGSGQGMASVAFSPDGGRLAAACDDGKAYVWDARTGRQLSTLAGHSSWVTKVEFSRDGARVLTAASDGAARLWQADTGKPLAALRGHYPVLLVGPPGAPQLSEQSQVTLVEAWAGRTEREVFESVKDAPFAVRPEGGPVSEFGAGPREAQGALFLALRLCRNIVLARFTPDGRHIVTAGGDGAVRVWDARSGACLRTLLDQARRESAPRRFAAVEQIVRWLARVWLTAAALSPDGSRMATGAEDGTVEVWDAGTGKLLWSAPAHRAPVASVAFRPDGRQLVSAPGERTARPWDAWLASRSPAPQGSAAPSDRTARVWDAATGSPISGLRCPATTLGASFVANGAQIVTAHTGKFAMSILWDAASGQSLRTFAGQPLAPSPDGTRLLATAWGGAALVEVATGQPVLTALGHSNVVNAAAFMPNAPCFATASADGTVKLWEAVESSAPARPTPLVYHVAQQVFCIPGAAVPDLVVLSKGGARLAAVAGQQAHVWDVATGAAVAAAEGLGRVGSGIDLSPDGRRLVVPLSAGGVAVLDLDANRRVCTHAGHTDVVYRARFSPDARRVVTASKDGTARIWDAATGRTQAVLAGHTAIVWDARFSPDGARVVTASNDHTARVWDARSGKLLATMHGHTTGLRDAAFSADGARVATTAADGTARVWDAATGTPIATLAVDGESAWRAQFTDGTAHLLVTAITEAGDLTARLWDVASVAPVRAFHGRGGDYPGTSLSPDGTRVVVADAAAARVWDPATGRELAVLEGHSGTVTHATFSADGECVVTAAKDGTLRLWRAVPWRSAAFPGDPSTPWRQRFADWRLGQYRRWQAGIR
ncbi:MAG TPA: protein kinase [Planctomycetota bacterium]|nr:protein kinase [Planctomycetota bacterium]